MIKTYSVEWNSIPYEFVGNWIPYRRATEIDPPEGNCFDEFEIFHNGYNFTDELRDDVVNELIGRAETKAMAGE